MYCIKCGANNVEGSNFCYKCGAPMLEHQYKNDPIMYVSPIYNSHPKNEISIRNIFGGIVLVIVIMIFAGVLKNAQSAVQKELGGSSRSSNYRQSSYSQSDYVSTSSKTSTNLSDSDFEIINEYKYAITTRRTIYYLIIKNNSSVTAGINGNMIAYDTNGNAIGAANAQIPRLGANEESIMEFDVWDEGNIDHVDYSFIYEDKSNRYPLSEGLDISKQYNDHNVIVIITNTSTTDRTLYTVEGLFFDQNNNIISIASDFIPHSTIPAGSSIALQLDVTYDYDHAECYLRATF